jgi:RNA polymerase sigma factor (sigma-70 family)
LPAEGEDMKTVIRHLKAAALLHEGPVLTDGQLLESFLSRRDGAAFEALLRRHGPLVLGVCRRVLRNAHDAEDAFQATFLVLVRKAGSLRSRELLANWLYGVAYRTAMKARAMNAKRRMKERQARLTLPPEGVSHEDLLERLDHELSRLPEKYRVPVVLCELEGKGRREAARLLGVPEGTLSWRLAQAKKMLARRLSRHGTATVAALLAGGAASACPSPALRASTAKAATTAGAVPAKVLALTEGVLKAMLLTKLKVTACAAALMVLAGLGATRLTYRATAEEPQTRVTYGAAPAGRAEGRPHADDLEALRLEIEALRKSLQATRGRVKALEDEVQALKGRGGAPPGQTTPPGKGKTPPLDASTPPPHGISGQPPATGGPAGGTNGPPAAPRSSTPGAAPKLPDGGGDPLAEAEAALRMLRDGPHDGDAAAALERALKRLKEREKPKAPAEARP